MGKQWSNKRIKKITQKKLGLYMKGGGGMYRVVAKQSEVSEELTASFFIVTGLVQVDVNEILTKKWVRYNGRSEAAPTGAIMEGGNKWQDCSERTEIFLHVTSAWN